MRVHPSRLRWPTLLFAVVWIGSTSWASAETRIIELTVRDRALPKDQRVIRVQQDDEVTLRWTTTHPITVHLHGYDLEVKVEMARPTTMKFRARATGRFPITTHAGARDKEGVLGYLEVQPR